MRDDNLDPGSDPAQPPPEPPPASATPPSSPPDAAVPPSPPLEQDTSSTFPSPTPGSTQQQSSGTPLSLWERIKKAIGG